MNSVGLMIAAGICGFTISNAFGLEKTLSILSIIVFNYILNHTG